MTKSVKVKIILIIVFLTLSAVIMTYKYFTQFKQTQIDEQEQEALAWDSPINQFEFAEPEDLEKNSQGSGSISKIDLTPQAFLKITYSTEPFVKAQNAKEIGDKIASFGKDPAIENFIKDMDKAIGKNGKDFSSLPSMEELQKQMGSTQTQKILLQYSKDPAFIKAMQKAMEDPDFAAGFINYIQNQTEQESSK